MLSITQYSCCHCLRLYALQIYTNDVRFKIDKIRHARKIDLVLQHTL